jgi:cytochrome P450
VERECSKDITYKGIQIKKGMLVRIPIYSVHLSEEYFPEPEKFDPDRYKRPPTWMNFNNWSEIISRWDPINKDKMNPYAFVPFGIGPRNCVGMKFSYEEIKIALANLVQRFRFYAVEETPVNVTDCFSGTLIV